MRTKQVSCSKGCSYFSNEVNFAGTQQYLEGENLKTRASVTKLFYICFSSQCEILFWEFNFPVQSAGILKD